MSRTGLNRFLLVVIAILVFLAWFLRRDFSQPNYSFTPEMVFSVPYDSFAANLNYSDGKTLQLPPPGTVARNAILFDYQPTEADALRAGEELTNPWTQPDIDADSLLAARDRGRKLFAVNCLPCHGALGIGDGPVAMRGFPAPPPFTSETSLEMNDGRMFHVITHGQRFLADKHMPGYAGQIRAEDRWQVVLHVRSLQQAAVRKLEADQLAQASIDVGKQVFQRLGCSKCHTVSADEKPVGPFLGKVAQAYSREQLHEAILHPSKSIAENFSEEVFLTVDGVTHSGFVTGETGEQVTIRNTDGNEIILAVADIEERRTLEKSPMPEGIIKDLPDAELQSLLDYLQSIASEGPVADNSSEPDPENGAQQDKPNP